jgi:hypothetical protein
VPGYGTMSGHRQANTGIDAVMKLDCRVQPARMTFSVRYLIRDTGGHDCALLGTVPMKTELNRRCAESCGDRPL